MRVPASAPETEDTGAGIGARSRGRAPRNEKGHIMRKIVLLCAAGMSTSMLVKKMQAAADAEGYECTVSAYAMSEAAKVGADADIVLLGPQVRFNVSKIQGQVPCPVEAIDMRAYGTMDGKAVIKRVKEVLGD